MQRRDFLAGAAGRRIVRRHRAVRPSAQDAAGRVMKFIPQSDLAVAGPDHHHRLRHAATTAT